tara:strand:+ start:86766 stop:87347 length:582 start_codon:yes stop_codon:yes gene_type:complete
MTVTDERKVSSEEHALELKKLLISVAEQKDRASFVKIFSEFEQKIRAFVLKRGVGAGEVDDVVQETMVAAWRYAPSYDPDKGGVSTWIYTIARNKTYDHFNRSSRPEPDYSDPSFVPDVETPENELEQSRLENLILKTVNNLPKEQALIVRMSFYEGKSHKTIAEDLSLPLGTVKSRMRLALKKIESNIGGKL